MKVTYEESRYRFQNSFIDQHDLSDHSIMREDLLDWSDWT